MNNLNNSASLNNCLKWSPSIFFSSDKRTNARASPISVRTSVSLSIVAKSLSKSFCGIFVSVFTKLLLIAASKRELDGLRWWRLL